MLFLCYPRCTTCQKARQRLEEQQVKFEVRDIKLARPHIEELRSWWKLSGLPLKRFFNTSGLLYKTLALKEKLPKLSEEEQLQLLASDGMLVKRPLLISKDFVLVGFKASEWSAKGL